jgi:hypothetical protein
MEPPWATVVIVVPVPIVAGRPVGRELGPATDKEFLEPHAARSVDGDCHSTKNQQAQEKSGYASLTKGACREFSRTRSPMEVILIIVVVVLLFGGGGYWSRGRYG